MLKSKTLLILLLSASMTLGALTPGWAAGAQDQIISIWDPLRTGEHLVIPLFTKSTGTWAADNSALPAMDWTVAFDGKSLGIAKTEATTFSTRDGGLADRQVAKGNLPPFDRPSLEKTIHGKTVHRPLILISQPYYQDPDKWKRRPLSPELAKRFREAFRKHYPTVQNCAKEGDTETPWAYTDSNIVFKDSYGSKNGSYVVGMVLTPYRCDEIADSPFLENWFGVTEPSAPHFMKERLELIDAGDYDRDGHSELIFEDRSEGGDEDNSSGYSLWSSDLNQQAEFIWFSH